MTTNKYRFWIAAAAAMMLSASAQPAAAQGKTFPTGPIELLVYTDPGTSVDLMLRALAPLLSEEVGKPVVVINRPGGSGSNALAYLTRRPANGYLLFGQTSTYASLVAKKVGGYTGQEVDYICRLVTAPIAITVRDDSPFKSVDDMVKYMKANPGKIRISGGAGAGSYSRLFAVSFKKKAGVEWTWVPFRSSSGSRRALIAGDLDVTFSAVGRVEMGRMLAVTSEKRFPFAADTPTLKELGYDIGNKVAWRGILIRKGVPADRKAYLVNAIRKATAKPAWKAFTNKLRAKQSLVCGADFAKLVTDEIAETTRYYKDLGIIK